jgi:hypothetical protein
MKSRIYTCAHCSTEFTNSAKLGGHVHAAHPEHKRAVPKWLSTSRPASGRPSIKRATDMWPARA